MRSKGNDETFRKLVDMQMRLARLEAMCRLETLSVSRQMWTKRRAWWRNGKGGSGASLALGQPCHWLS